jgi:hypothetical protein
VHHRSVAAGCDVGCQGGGDVRGAAISHIIEKRDTQPVVTLPPVMVVPILRFVPKSLRLWVMAAMFTIAAYAAHAGHAPPQSRGLRAYQPVFQACRDAAGVKMLAIRRMEIDGTATLLSVDPATLATRLVHTQDWSCTDTNDDQQKETRYLKAVRASIITPAKTPVPASGLIAYGGLLRGSPVGSFVTGDLCPSRKALDRAFLEKLQSVQSPLPIALGISGLWLTAHRADFAWLRAQERAGLLQITWVDHSYHHPYIAGRALADNFLLMPGIDIRAEILNTEKLLVANGETPSVFFRFPGLMSNASLNQVAGDDHLIVLGAGAWLARTPRARPGDIILIHANGNEPVGLKIFAALLESGKIAKPFRPIEDAP